MKTLKVRQRNIHLGGNGQLCLRIVMGNRFKNNGYTHINLNGKNYGASVTSNIVWLDS